MAGLARLGWVERLVDPDDRRNAIIELTAAGSHALAQSLALLRRPGEIGAILAQIACGTSSATKPHVVQRLVDRFADRLRGYARKFASKAYPVFDERFAMWRDDDVDAIDAFEDARWRDLDADLHVFLPAPTRSSAHAAASRTSSVS